MGSTLIRKISIDYVYHSNEDLAVQECFEYTPSPKRDLTFNEIEDTLKQNGYHVNSNKLGAALKRLSPNGKIIKKKNGKRVYLLDIKESVVFVKVSASDY